jgi:dihydrolipoamide dehydrogenase
MSKGVQFLMKKNKIDVIFGYGTLKRGKKVSVKAEDGSESEISADHIIIATGARSRELPSLPQDGKKVIGYREAMTLSKQPKKNDRGRFGSYWNRICLFLQRYGYRSNHR